MSYHKEDIDRFVRRLRALREATMSGIGGSGGGSMPGLTGATFPMPFKLVFKRTFPNFIAIPKRKKRK